MRAEYDCAWPLASARRCFPGILTSVVLAMASTFLSEHYGGPTLMYALLFGMAFHFLLEHAAIGAGVGFSARTILRIGVALLGVQIDAGRIVDLGMLPLVVVALGIPLTILTGRFVAGRLGLTRTQGVLTGGAVAICGASAALAISAVLPRTRESERDTLFTVLAVTALSTVAMVAYPLLAGVLDLADEAAGIFMGGTIHDVAQVVAAGYMVSDEAGIVATFVKLMRVAALVPAVLVIGWLFRTPGDADAPRRVQPLPAFLVAFVVLAAANSLGAVPPPAAAAAGDLSRWCLVTAIAALGVKTSLKELAAVGWRPILLTVIETLVLAAFVLGLLLTAPGA